MVDVLIGGAITLVVSGVTFLLGKRKTFAEIEKLKAEAEQIKLNNKISELNFFDRVNKVLVEQNEKNAEYIKRLEDRISELELMVKNLNGKQCLESACPTKQEYDKIIAKRDARKRALAKKQDSKL